MFKIYTITTSTKSTHIPSNSIAHFIYIVFSRCLCMWMLRNGIAYGKVGKYSALSPLLRPINHVLFPLLRFLWSFSAKARLILSDRAIQFIRSLQPKWASYVHAACLFPSGVSFRSRSSLTCQTNETVAAIYGIWILSPVFFSGSVGIRYGWHQVLFF